MDADAAPTASGPISKGDPRLRADPDRAWTPIEPGHGGEATRAQAGWLEQAEEGVGRGALLLASATFLRKLLNHHRNREKVKFYDQVLTSCVKNMSVGVVRRCGSSSSSSRASKLGEIVDRGACCNDNDTYDHARV